MEASMAAGREKTHCVSHPWRQTKCSYNHLPRASKYIHDKKSHGFFIFDIQLPQSRKQVKSTICVFQGCHQPKIAWRKNLIKATFEVFQFEIKNQEFLRVLCLNFYQVHWGACISFKVKEATCRGSYCTRNHISVFQWLCHTTPCSMSPFKRPHFPTPLNISSISFVSTQSSLFGFWVSTTQKLPDGWHRPT